MLNRLRIGTRIGGSFALGLALLSAIGILSYRTTVNLIENSRRENHTYQVLGQLKELNFQLISAETGQRGYIVTGQSRYLEPYDEALENINRDFEELRQLTSDNLNQQRRLDQLEPLLDRRLDRLREGIRVRDIGGLAAAQNFTLSDEGRQLMQQIRGITDEMEAEERQLLQLRSQEAQQAATQTLDTIRIGIPASFIILSLVGLWLSRNISEPLRQLASTAQKIAEGNLSVSLPMTNSKDETGVLTRTFSQMITSLRETIQTNEDQRWLKSNVADVSQMVQGHRNLETVGRLILSKVAPLVGAQQGVFYIMDTTGDEPVLRLLSSYAHRERRHVANQFHLGEGLVGQCALEKASIVLTDVPQDYIRIGSGLGEIAPTNIAVVPLLFEEKVTGVIELASLQRFIPLQITLLEDVSQSLGVILNAIASFIQMQQLFEQSQQLTEELQNQQEELLKSNQLLEEQARSLRESELLLQQQQEELQQSNEELQQLNEELEEKAELLERQKQEVEHKNQEIEQARQALEDKAEQLAMSSKYKSEFLANMSHELRTPLNSLLILAKMLSENGDSNLTEKQVEYSRTIYSAGADLLSLINDILDLAKIESGTMSIDIQSISFTTLQLDLERTFREVASSRDLSFAIELSDDLPSRITTDPKRLQQILKNLLSNAFKFTDRGGVTLKISGAANNMIAFAVRDTGIGIPQEKQQIIFEAFQQADGTTSRKYGGTGLGLSISLELAHLLKGAIDLQSTVGEGSTFTLSLPEVYPAETNQQSSVNTPVSFSTAISLPADPVPGIRFNTLLPDNLEDDRANLQVGDRILLVIEDDFNFARILQEMARNQGFKVLLSSQGSTGLELAQTYIPNAITLDLHLPDMEGWSVLEQLKQNSKTRHIPVHILSVDEQQQREFQMGAIAHIQKPVSPEVLTQALVDIKRFIERQVKQLLIIEDDPNQAQSIIELIGGRDVQSTAVSTGAAALEALRTHPFDCVVLDLGLPDQNGFELIEQIKQTPELARLPIIVYTGRELNQQEETQLKRLAETIIIKDVRSPERLLDETALFLHRVQSNLPTTQQQLLEQARRSDPTLTGKTVLIVDDDVRNVFALTSLLEQYGMSILFAENGREGLTTLEANLHIDLVLMDVMMPELDGYETTQLIRKQERFRSLPIVALTAKAMQGDREKCIEAGASDYITKPVDPEQLLSLLRLWLYS